MYYQIKVCEDEVSFPKPEEGKTTFHPHKTWSFFKKVVKSQRVTFYFYVFHTQSEPF